MMHPIPAPEPAVSGGPPIVAPIPTEHRAAPARPRSRLTDWLGAIVYWGILAFGLTAPVAGAILGRLGH